MKRETITIVGAGLHQPDGTTAPGKKTTASAKVWPRTLQDAERGTVPIEGFGVQAFGKAGQAAVTDGRVIIRGKEQQVEGSVARYDRYVIFVTKKVA